MAEPLLVGARRRPRAARSGAPAVPRPRAAAADPARHRPRRRRRRVVALVGESGSGKSTLARTVLRLHEPQAGRIVFAGQDITHAGEAEAGAAAPAHADDLPGPDVVAQSAASHRRDRRPAAARRRGATAGAATVLARCSSGSSLPAEFADRYPHELSGGQRQRVGIARAIALRAGADRRRRDRLRARRVDAGAHPAAAARAEARARPGADLRHPRPVGRARAVRSRRRAARRAGRRDGAGRAAVRAAGKRLQPRLAGCDTVARCRSALARPRQRSKGRGR